MPEAIPASPREPAPAGLDSPTACGRSGRACLRPGQLPIYCQIKGVVVQVPDWLASVVLGAASVFAVLRVVLRRWIPSLSEDTIISIRAIRKVQTELRKGREQSRTTLPRGEDQTAG
ncbi:hypothetical protein GCM10009639_47790 [Kitasatospora putterlickiae]|uniref:Uncharacterized protein n=1 Tax=Kitasatospora putterlickiae TaxID=221725 RepID=A0ABN1YBK8_9ACTN